MENEKINIIAAFIFLIFKLKFAGWYDLFCCHLSDHFDKFEPPCFHHFSNCCFILSVKWYQEKTSQKALIINVDNLLSLADSMELLLIRITLVSILTQNVFGFKNCSIQFKFCRKLVVHTTNFSC